MEIDIELLRKERKQWRENSLLQSQSILRLSQELDNLRKQKEILQEKLLKSATQDQMKINKLYTYPKSMRSVVNGGRHYDINGGKLPSVTTIL